MPEPESSDGSTPRGGQEEVLNADQECVSVDAGAGTGKTTTMRWRIEDMLTADDPPPSDRVRVLTFANEAASSIEKSTRGAEQLSIDEAYNVDVYTYHSFCSRLVSEYAYVLGIDPDFEVVTEDQRLRIIQSLIDEHDYQYVSKRQNDTGAVLKQAEDYIQKMRQEAITPAAIDEFLPSRTTIDNLKCLVIDVERTAYLFDTDEHEVVNDNYDVDYLAIFDHLEEYREALTRWQRVAQNRSQDIWDTIDSYLHFLELWTDMIKALLYHDFETTFGFLP